MLNIGNKRECFFDSYLIDEEKTSAKHLLHHPEKKNLVLTHDAPWESTAAGFHNVFFDPLWHGVDGKNEKGTYRMYYYGLSGDEYKGEFCICYAESADGIHFEKPSLGICEFSGSRDNNIIIDKNIHPESCQLYVFYDQNPDCPKDEKYKGITAWDLPKIPGKKNEFRLFTMLSEDGLHFRFGEMISNKGYFDSLNIIFWDEKDEIYRLYARGITLKGENRAPDDWDKLAGKIFEDSTAGKAPEVIRAVIYMESKDYKTWTDPVWLKYDDDDEYHIYTNGIGRYFRAPDIFIGLPTRYIQRADWTENYDELCGREIRRPRYESFNPRAGLALTDCGFMTSRDGIHFHRYKNAFMRPGTEHPIGWLYGDCFLSPHPIVTASDTKGADDELSFFCTSGHTVAISELYRYTLRQDGFVSLHAEENEETVITKPFIYEGESLYANISTSAFGHLYFTLLCDGEKVESCEIFGDSVDKKIHFPADAVKRFAGKEVVLQINLYDADVYSINFR